MLVANLKHFHATIIHWQNKATMKQAKLELVVLPRATARKFVITMNSEGVPMIPSRNQWFLAMKGHACHLLKVTKAINLQAIEKLEKVKENLEKQFEFIAFGLNYGPM
jgi:hypothetical protein